MTKEAVSCSGKVMLVGGYLVLFPEYSALILSANARICSVSESIPGPIDRTSSLPFRVTVSSPQFLWSLAYDYIENSNFASLHPKEKGPGNKYIETTVLNTLAFAHSLNKERFEKIALASDLKITIYGDNDFYSQREELKKLGLPISSASLSSLPRFNRMNKTFEHVAKTGLGSSAALVTSLVGSILSHFRVVDLRDPTEKGEKGEESSKRGKRGREEDLSLVHNLAQFCHCLAQGKIGSGFDVAAAVFGSLRYKRFSPSVLEGLLNKTQSDSTPPIDELVSTITNFGNWDHEIKPFELPYGLEIFLGDISTGSSTPKMVSKVLDWRKSKPLEADALWNDLGKKNDKVEDLFRELEKQHRVNPQEYLLTLERCASLPSSKWKDATTPETSKTLELLVGLAETFSQVREKLREMSEKSDVPIEPAEQTRLLDASLSLNGTLLAGVPGAGGFDAIFCIYLGGAKTKESLEKLWIDWKEMSVSPLLVSRSDKGILFDAHFHPPY